jgi:2-(1,2-epoxy-1,2-dihydrophenyl)acetyl-CoA isomerase
VAPHEKLAEETRALAERLAAAPQTSVLAAKRLLRASPGWSLEQCLDAEIEAQRACWMSPDSTEGVRAFVDKRKPAFGQGAGGDLAPPSVAARVFE